MALKFIVEIAGSYFIFANIPAKKFTNHGY